MAHPAVQAEVAEAVDSALRQGLVLVPVFQSLSPSVLVVSAAVRTLLVVILLRALAKTLFSALLSPSAGVAAVARTTSRQTAGQAAAAAAGPTNLPSKMLVLERLVKATVVPQASITTAEAAAVAQVLLVRYSMAATDLQVPSQECLSHTLVEVEQVVTQLLGTAAQAEAVTVLPTPMSLHLE